MIIAFTFDPVSFALGALAGCAIFYIYTVRYT